jgi:hypothetical protein
MLRRAAANHLAHGHLRPAASSSGAGPAARSAQAQSFFFVCFGWRPSRGNGPPARSSPAPRPQPGPGPGKLAPAWAESGPTSFLANLSHWMRSDGCAWISGDQKPHPACYTRKP